MHLRRTHALLVHGFDGYAAKDCRELAALRSGLGPLATVVGYYVGDTHADVTLPGEPATTDTSITVLGRGLADFVAALPGPVDLVGHSMGGLVIQEALHLLPTMRVRRVVMLGVPFAGLPSAAGTDVSQCREMAPGSTYLAAGAARGWRADLCVGSEADEAVPITSSLPVGLGRQLRLPARLAIHHGDLVTDARVVRRVERSLRGSMRLTRLHSAARVQPELDA